MTDPIATRKDDHLRVAATGAHVDRDHRHFDAIRLTHRALPEIDFDRIDPATEFLGKRIRFPLLIAPMTGGPPGPATATTRNLAIAAEATGVAMAVGSQRIMFRHPATRGSFAIRAHAPTAPLLANLGAVQLNLGFGPAECEEAIAAVDADALSLHLNPLQEVIQPEGNTTYAGLADRIGEVAARLSRPVIVKEVGAGLSLDDARLLADRGIRYLDVAGAGGTSWSRIEHLRGGRHRDLGLTFQDWGIPTPVALRGLQPLAGRVTIIASGGVRTGIDMAKAIILGADLCGIALPLLEPATRSPEAVIDAVERLRQQFTTAMFLLGVPTVAKLKGNHALLLNA